MEAIQEGIYGFMRMASRFALAEQKKHGGHLGIGLVTERIRHRLCRQALCEAGSQGFGILVTIW
jgi:hypothetical protein